jgi:hypothetical protein
VSLCDVPHLHVTLTINDLLWPFFLAYRSLLKLLLKTAAQAALEALRLQVPLFDPEPTLRHLKWRERIKASFGYDPLECPRCGLTMELVETWEPKRGHIWMKRWLETHRFQPFGGYAMCPDAFPRAPKSPVSGSCPATTQ